MTSDRKDQNAAPTFEEIWAEKLEEFRRDQMMAEVDASVDVTESTTQEVFDLPVEAGSTQKHLEYEALDAQGTTAVSSQPALRKTARRTVFFRILAALLACAVFLLFTTPSLVNIYQDTIRWKRIEAQESYHQLSNSIVISMEEASTVMLMQGDAESELPDQITRSYAEGAEALRALLIERLDSARTADDIDFELAEYERYRKILTEEFMRIYSDYQERALPPTVIS